MSTLVSATEVLELGFPGFRRFPLHAAATPTYRYIRTTTELAHRVYSLFWIRQLSIEAVSPAPARDAKTVRGQGGPTERPALAYVTRSPGHQTLRRSPGVPTPQRQAASELQRPLSHNKPE